MLQKRAVDSTQIEKLAATFLQTKSYGCKAGTFMMGPYLLEVMAEGFSILRNGEKVPGHAKLETGKDGGSAGVVDMARELAHLELTEFFPDPA